MTTIVDTIKSYYNLTSKLNERLALAGHTGITAEGAVLLHVLGSGQMPINRLRGTCYFGTDPSYTLRRLEEQRYIIRQDNPDDGRGQIIKATASGRGVGKLVSELEGELV